MSVTLGTIRLPYRVFRAAVSNGSTDSDLTASTKSWASFVTNHYPQSGGGALAIKLEERDNRAIIVFDHTTAADTAAFIIYGYREGWPAEFICSVDTLTAGSQESNYPLPESTTRFFADEIGTITGSNRWHETVTEVDSAGGDGMAKLRFDTFGIKYLLILFTAVSAGSVSSFISFY